MQIIDDILQYIDKLSKTHINKYRAKINNVQKKLDAVNGKMVMNTFYGDNDYKLSYESRVLIKKIEELESYMQLTDYIKKEINKINKIVDNIPNEIELLLSSYGTFYDGGDTFYCNQKLSIKEMMECLINHIAHYSIGLYFAQYSNVENRILQFFAACGLLDNKEEYDFNPLLIKYFNRIYRDEIANMIIFVPSNNYKQYMYELIINNKFDKCAKFISYADYKKKDQINCILFLNKNVKTCGVYNKLHVTYFDIKLLNKNAARSDRFEFFNEYRHESFYFELNDDIKNLLKSNNIKIIKA